MLTPLLGLCRSETLEASLRRVLMEQLDVAAPGLTLESEPEALGRAVHHARRTLKKIRALLRMIASGEGGQAVAAPLIDLRDAGRALAPLRDADVLVTIVRASAAGLPASHDPGSLANLEELLVAKRESVLDARSDVMLATAARHTDAARRAIEGWTPLATDFDLIRAGIGDWYGRARIAMGAACGGTKAEVFHKWRKRTKDVRHQLEFLAPIASELVAATADIHRLTDLLGDANDLDHLEAAARSLDPAGFNAADPAFLFLVDQRRSLWGAACSLGQELFAEGSDGYTSRLECHWESWIAEEAESANVGQG